MADNKIKLADLLAARTPEARQLLTLLQSIQNHYKYLPEEAIRAVADYLKLSIAQVFSVTTFYSALSLKPKGDTVIKVCCGTACHLSGAPALITSLKEELALNIGHTSSDGTYTLESVNCVGACALAPVVTVNDLAHGDQTPASVKKLCCSPNQA